MTHTPLADQQARTAITAELSTTFFVEAGAGSGKSTAMVQRIAALVDHGTDILTIAAITFTEKAALELRGKVRAALASPTSDPTLEERRATALADLDSAPIGTIHSFCQRILQMLPLQAGVPPRVNVEDASRSAASFAAMWHGLQREILDGDHARALVALQRAGMDRRQLPRIAAALHEDWHLTRAWLAAEDDRVSRARRELPRLIDQLHQESETAIAEISGAPKTVAKISAHLTRHLELLSDLPPEARHGEDPAALLAALAGMSDLKPGRARLWGSVEQTRERTDALNALRAEATALAVDEVLLPLVREAGLRIVDATSARVRTGRLQFQDLLILARDLLLGPHHAEAHAVLHARFAAILVDEFQDTDPLQAEVILRIAGKTSVPELPWQKVQVAPGHLFVVGDPKQSIYRFRRADIAVYEQVRDVLRDSGGEVVSLTTNFRSDADLLAWVNRTFGEIMQEEPQVQPHFEALVPRPRAAAGGDAVVSSYLADPSDRTASAAAIADAASRLITEEGFAPQGIAILLRTRRLLEDLEDSLDARGIEFRAEASNLIYGTPEVRELLLLLKAAANPADSGSVLLALRTSLLGCGDDDLARWRLGGGAWALPPADGAPLPRGPVAEGLAEIARLRVDARDRSPADLLQGLIDVHLVHAVLGDSPRHRDLSRRLTFIVDQARAWWEEQRGTLRDYLAFVAQQESDSAAPTETVLDETDSSAVRLLTMHTAKGLEFPAVVVETADRSRGDNPALLWADDGAPVLAASTGLVTSGYAEVKEVESAALAAEALRLMYVATTRAERRLVVPHYPGKVKLSKSPSPLDLFLHEASTPVPDPAPPVEAGGSISAAAAVDPAGMVAQSDPAVPTSALAIDEAPTWLQDWRARRETWTAAAQLSATRTVTSRAHAPETAEEAIEALAPTAPADAAEAESLAGVVESGTAFGTAFHRVLELTRLDPSADVDALASQVTSTDASLGQERLAEMARWALDSPPIREARESGRYWFELDVIAPGPEGAVVVGRADFVHLDAQGRLVVTDFKSDIAVQPQRLEEYRTQVRTYLDLIARATGTEPGRGVLLFAAPQLQRVVEC